MVCLKMFYCSHLQLSNLNHSYTFVLCTIQLFWYHSNSPVIHFYKKRHGLLIYTIVYLMLPSLKCIWLYILQSHIVIIILFNSIWIISSYTCIWFSELLTAASYYIFSTSDQNTSYTLMEAINYIKKLQAECVQRQALTDRLNEAYNKCMDLALRLQVIVFNSSKIYTSLITTSIK